MRKQLYISHASHLNGSCLTQDKITYTNEKITNNCTVHELSSNLNHNGNVNLETCLFVAVTLTKNADINKYKCSEYSIGFDRHEMFLFPSRGFGQRVIIFGVNMSSFVHVESKIKDILIFGETPTKGLNDTTLFAEKNYSINFTVNCKITFKGKDSEIVATQLRLGNISESISTVNSK